jgi:hypothetical protein
MYISAVFRSRSRARIGNIEKNQGIPFSGILCIFSVEIVRLLQVFRFLRSMMVERLSGEEPAERMSHDTEKQLFSAFTLFPRCKQTETYASFVQLFGS